MNTALITLSKITSSSLVKEDTNPTSSIVLNKVDINEAVYNFQMEYFQGHCEVQLVQCCMMTSKDHPSNEDTNSANQET